MKIKIVHIDNFDLFKAGIFSLTKKEEVLNTEFVEFRVTGMDLDRKKVSVV